MTDLEILKARAAAVPAGEMVAVYAETVLALIEEDERLREFLAEIANPQPHTRNLPSCCQHIFDDTCELFSDIARALLKETTDD